MLAGLILPWTVSNNLPIPSHVQTVISIIPRDLIPTIVELLPWSTMKNIRLTSRYWRDAVTNHVVCLSTEKTFNFSNDNFLLLFPKLSRVEGTVVLNQRNIIRLPLTLKQVHIGNVWMKAKYEHLGDKALGILTMLGMNNKNHKDISFSFFEKGMIRCYHQGTIIITHKGNTDYPSRDKFLEIIIDWPVERLIVCTNNISGIFYLKMAVIVSRLEHKTSIPRRLPASVISLMGKFDLTEFMADVDGNIPEIKQLRCKSITGTSIAPVYRDSKVRNKMSLLEMMKE